MKNILEFIQRIVKIIEHVILRLFPKHMMAYYLVKPPLIKLLWERSNTDYVSIKRRIRKSKIYMYLLKLLDCYSLYILY